jgi:class 3 adenylate cyclase
MDVTAWLRGLGLERYEAAFRDNEIDWAALAKLTAEDLKDLGVVLGSHRRRLLEAIAALQSETGAAAEQASTVPAAERRSPLPTPGMPARAGAHGLNPWAEDPRPGAPPLAGEGGVVGVDAERRQLTVMFCDLVGSTELSSRLDPEDLREVISAYHRAVAEVVGSFDGFVAKYMGDGVLVYFGYPRAHEDDAERAVRAGLGLITAVGRLDVKSVKLQARVGVATGLVVVGDLIGEGSAREQSVVGETPNLAARLQALAEPGVVVIAAGHPPAGRRSLRIPRSRRRRVEGHRRAGVGLAGAASERPREPVRGLARLGADPAGRSRRGARPAAAALGALQGGGGPGRAGLRRARHRQVAPRGGACYVTPKERRKRTHAPSSPRPGTQSQADQPGTRCNRCYERLENISKETRAEPETAPCSSPFPRTPDEMPIGLRFRRG